MPKETKTSLRLSTLVEEGWTVDDLAGELARSDPVVTPKYVTSTQEYLIARHAGPLYWAIGLGVLVAQVGILFSFASHLHNEGQAYAGIYRAHPNAADIHQFFRSQVRARPKRPDVGATLAETVGGRLVGT
jgi:hypothetical protein